MKTWRKNMPQQGLAVMVAETADTAPVEVSNLGSNNLLNQVLTQEYESTHVESAEDNILVEETVESEREVSKRLDKAVKNITSYHVGNLVRMVTKSVE
jgi:hypothetical protein